MAMLVVMPVTVGRAVVVVVVVEIVLMQAGMV